MRYRGENLLEESVKDRYRGGYRGRLVESVLERGGDEERERKPLMPHHDHFSSMLLPFLLMRL